MTRSSVAIRKLQEADRLERSDSPATRLRGACVRQEAMSLLRPEQGIQVAGGEALPTGEGLTDEQWGIKDTLENPDVIASWRRRTGPP